MNFLLSHPRRARTTLGFFILFLGAGIVDLGWKVTGLIFMLIGASLASLFYIGDE